jgi:hypothetical protein
LNILKAFLISIVFAAAASVEAALVPSSATVELSDPKRPIHLEEVPNFMQVAIQKFDPERQISQLHKFEKGTTNAYLVSLVDGEHIVFKDSRKQEVEHNIEALRKLGGRGNQPVHLGDMEYPWGRFVTITHVYLYGEWYGIGDLAVPDLLLKCEDFMFMEMGGRRSGTSIPTVQPFFAGKGNFDDLSPEAQIEFAERLAQAIVFAKQHRIVLGDLHVNNYLYDPLKKEVAFIDLDPHESHIIPNVLMHQWICPKYGVFHTDSNFTVACRLLKNLYKHGTCTDIPNAVLEYMKNGDQTGARNTFLGFLVSDARMGKRFGLEIRNLFESVQGEIDGAFEGKRLITFVEEEYEGRPELLASNYLEQCLFGTLRGCEYCTSGSYEDSARRMGESFGEGVARLAAETNFLRLALWFYVTMNIMDPEHVGWDKDFVEFTIIYALRDQLWTGVFSGEHIGNQAKEWQKMIRGPNKDNYGKPLLGDLYD